MNDYVRIQVEVVGNGQASTLTLIEPLLVGDFMSVKVHKAAAEAAALAMVDRSLTYSAGPIEIDRR